jgi:hypothetical protein
MKALNYLQKVGAIPSYESWDLLMSLVVIVTDFFSPDLMVEPDVLDWVQDSESSDEFEDRCNAIVYATSGDVRALFPHIYDKPVPFLRDLLEALIDIRLRIYVFAAPSAKSHAKDWFSENYNDMVGLKGDKRFPSKSTILHSYCSGSLTDGGQEILASIVGTKKDFEKEINKLQNSFSLFVSNGDTLSVNSVELCDERENPFEGGYQAKVKLTVPGVDEPQECTLHWAPWPSARTNSANQLVRSVCSSFTEMNRETWFSSLGV